MSPWETILVILSVPPVIAFCDLAVTLPRPATEKLVAPTLPAAPELWATTSVLLVERQMHLPGLDEPSGTKVTLPCVRKVWPLALMPVPAGTSEGASPVHGPA